MKICWNNLEELKYNNKTDRWYRKTIKKSYIYKEIYYYVEKYNECGESFLSKIGNKGEYCSMSCSKKNKSLSITHKKRKRINLKNEIQSIYK